MKNPTLAVKAEGTDEKISVTLEGSKGSLMDYIALSGAIVEALLSKFNELSGSELPLNTAFAASMMETIKQHEWEEGEK